jgi:anti-sigma factor RsiW
MTPDEARELFPDALDGALSVAQQRAFDAALGEHPELKAEWAELRDLMSETAAIAEADAAVAPSVDLLRGVQTKLRRRSGGRFYRDRFSRDVGRGAQMWPLVAATVMLLVLGTAWYVLHFAQELAP